MKPQALIVGAGPVGLTMAAELARYGVAVRIVDKAAERTDKSKALVLWSRTLELIDRMGCGASFVDAGLKVTATNIIAGAAGIAHVRLDDRDAAPYGLMLPQSETERLMEQHLNSWASRSSGRSNWCDSSRTRTGDGHRCATRMDARRRSTPPG